MGDATVTIRLGTGPIGPLYVATRPDGSRLRVEVADDPTAAGAEMVHASRLGPVLVEPISGLLLTEVASAGARLPAGDVLAWVAAIARHLAQQGPHGDLGLDRIALRPEGWALLGAHRAGARPGSDVRFLAQLVLSLTLGQPLQTAAPVEADARRWVFRLRFALGGEHGDVAEIVSSCLTGDPAHRPLPIDLAVAFEAAAARLGGTQAAALRALAEGPVAPLVGQPDAATGTPLGLGSAPTPTPAVSAAITLPPDPSDLDAPVAARLVPRPPPEPQPPVQAPTTPAPVQAPEPPLAPAAAARTPEPPRPAEGGLSMLPWLVTLGALVVVGAIAFMGLVVVGIGARSPESPPPPPPPPSPAATATPPPPPAVAPIADDPPAPDAVDPDVTPDPPQPTRAARPAAAAEADPWGAGAAAPRLEVTTEGAAGSFKVKGDAMDVRLVSGSRSFGEGEVPAGTYVVLAMFDAWSPAAEVGSATVTAGRDVTVTCRSKSRECSVK